jgi:hypothetical protein
VKISNALEGVQRLYTETAPLIYYVEENPNYVTKMEAIIEAIEDRPIEAVSSVITLTEVLTRPLKLGNARLERVRCTPLSRQFKPQNKIDCYADEPKYTAAGV